MEILVIGTEYHLAECQQKFGDSHHYQLLKDLSQAIKQLKNETLVFDFIIADEPKQIHMYQKFNGIAFLNTTNTTLNTLLSENLIRSTVFGFCGMPTFLNREVLEVSMINENHKIKLEEICHLLNTSFVAVKDQVGLVTPRIICMIINEAYFAVQENIASRKDIDLAMKLGTNYPFGPFEWCERIGIKNVYELLNAVYKSTNDERYKICDLLKKEAKKG